MDDINLGSGKIEIISPSKKSPKRKKKTSELSNDINSNIRKSNNNAEDSTVDSFGLLQRVDDGRKNEKKKYLNMTDTIDDDELENDLISNDKRLGVPLMSKENRILMNSREKHVI